MADLWPLTLAGILMDNTPDADGVRWRVLGFEGWDGITARVDDGERTGRHGGYGSSRLYPARQMTLLIRAHCPDLATAAAVRDSVPGIVPPGASVTLEVQEPIEKALTVVLGDGEVRAARPRGPMHRVNIQIPLIAHDPLKRSTTARTTPVASASTVAVDNDGTAAADLLVTLTSGGTVVLTSGGLTLTTTTLPSGAVIDTGACTVTSSGGADLFAAVVPGSQWPALPAGGGSVQQAGTAGLSVVTHDSYA